jgi:hypothetical protein
MVEHLQTELHVTEEKNKYFSSVIGISRTFLNLLKFESRGQTESLLV